MIILINSVKVISHGPGNLVDKIKETYELATVMI